MKTRAATGEARWRELVGEAGVRGGLTERLAVFLDLLERWGRSVNLVGDDRPEVIIRSHVLESLAGAPFLPTAGALLDVGSGNGFPAVPLLLARPDLSGVLLEPRERRWAFLREVGRELAMSVTVVRENVREHTGCYAAMTVRGVERAVWWPHVARLLAPGGVALWWHTGEAGPAGGRLDRVVTSPLPDPGRGWLSVWRRCST